MWASASPVTSSTLASSSTTGWPPTGSGLRRRLADHHLGEVRPAVDLAAAGTEAGGGDPSWRAWARTRSARAASSAAPVGVVELHRQVDPAGGDAAQELDDGRRRVRQHARAALRTMPVPMAIGDSSTSSTSSTSRAAQVPTTSTIASMPPTSWKCTWSGGPPVQPALGLGQRAEQARGPGLTRPGRRASRPGPDVGRSADDLVSCDVDVDLVAPMPPRRTGSASSPSLRPGAARAVEHLVEVGAGVHQRAEGHVAGDPGEAVEPGAGHGRPRGWHSSSCRW